MMISFQLNKPRYATWIVLILSLAGSKPSADAAFHLWFIKEAYSNQSGSVQFIELFTTSSLSQEFVFGQTLTTSTNSHTFTFPANSPSPTTNHHLLLATSGFASIPGGATPDFTIPSNFFNPAGDTLVYAGGFDSKSFDMSISPPPMPTDGINSLNYTGPFSAATVAANSPRNYAGSGGSVNLPPSPTGDYNGNHTVDAADYAVWRKTVGPNSVSPGTGADGTGDGIINAADYTFWRARFGNPAGSGTGLGAGAAVPEPAGALLLLALLAMHFGRRRR